MRLWPGKNWSIPKSNPKEIALTSQGYFVQEKNITMPGVTHFLFVAIEKYNDPKEFGNVLFAEKDAKEVMEAFKAIGHLEENMTILLNGHATAKAIEHQVIKMVEKTRSFDRLVFYFSGHGLNIAGDNFIVPADALFDRAKDMCVSTNLILNHLISAEAVQKILFLDCCHSGLEPGEYIRGGIKGFAGDALEYQFRNAEFCVGFASCKSGQTSLSHPRLKNGVWSHFLIKALSGDAEKDTYKGGVLLATDLQDYLNEMTYEFLQRNTTDRKVQTPIQFGSTTGNFVVANVNPVFENRALLKAADKLTLKSVSMYIVEDGKIKDLENFDKRKGHFVPDKVAPVHDRFVKTASADIVKNEISKLSQEIRTGLKYKRIEIEVEVDNGEGSIETPDFIFSMIVNQSEEDPSKYEIRRSLDKIINAEIIHTPIFNKIFDKYFNTLSFSFNKPINVAQWIDILEDKGLDVSFNPAHIDRCKLNLEGLDTEIIIMSDRLDIFFTYSQSPHFIIDAYKTASIQLAAADINLLN